MASVGGVAQEWAGPGESRFRLEELREQGGALRRPGQQLAAPALYTVWATVASKVALHAAHVPEPAFVP